MNKYFKELDELKNKLCNTLNNIDKNKLLQIDENIWKNILVEYTYHSNAIEGNKLSLIETKVILEDKIAVGGKSLKDHFEALNHKEAILYIKELSEEGHDINETFIKVIHSYILRNIDDMNAGIYRNKRVTIIGARINTTNPNYIPFKMEKLIEDYYTELKNKHPIEKAMIFHARFIGIHPFIDGNGRTGRLIMNWILLKNNYPLVIIPVERREEYFKCLDKAIIENNFNDFSKLIYDIMKKSYERYFFRLS